MFVVRPNTYRVSGDGIHPDANGHAVVAAALLKALSAPGLGDEEMVKHAANALKTLKADNGAFDVVWRGRLPLQADAGWHKKLAEVLDLSEKGGQVRLKLEALTEDRYALKEEETTLASFTKQQLADGIDLLALPNISTKKRAAELRKLYDDRQRLLGLAWLTEVGHKRPDTPKGIPLADAQQQASEMDKKILELRKPIELTLRLVPVK